MKRNFILSLMICGLLCGGLALPAFAKDVITNTEKDPSEGKIKPKHPHKRLHKSKTTHKKHMKTVKQTKDESVKEGAPAAVPVGKD